MTVTYRRPEASEHVAAVRLFVDVMNQRASDEDIERGHDTFELDRSWVADDGDRIVGTITTHSFQMVVPGGGQAPLAGLTLVSVAPTHRRSGVGRRLVLTAANHGTGCRCVVRERNLITFYSVWCLVAYIAVFTIYINQHKDRTAKGIFFTALVFGLAILLLKIFS